MSMSMAMKATAPNEIRFTLNVTMTLEEWLKIKEQLQPSGTYTSAWPARGFLEQIDDAVRKAGEAYYPAVASQMNPPVGIAGYDPGLTASEVAQARGGGSGL